MVTEARTGWKTKEAIDNELPLFRKEKPDFSTLLIGAVIGALTGAGAAYMLVQRAKRNEDEVSISTGEGLRLGFLILGLLRSIAALGDDD